MDEVWIRGAWLTGALVVAVGAALFLRQSRGRGRTVTTGDLSPGVYLFTSSTCSTCAKAREKMVTNLGRDGFSEVVWEKEPGLFGEVGVDAVPAVVVVEKFGLGRLYPGQPDRALVDV